MGAGDGQLVLLRQLVHTQDGDDILQRLVILQDLLDSSSAGVVFMSNNVGVEDTGRRVKRIDGGVNTQLGDATGQHSRGVQMGEGSGRGGIGQIVSGHINGLHGSDRTLSGGGNSLLHATHVSGQSGLVTDGGRNTTEQSGHFRTGLSESENVVDEEQHVLAFVITEIFGYGQSGQADTGTGAWGLVHLSVHERDLGGLLGQGNDTTLNHLVVQIVSFAGSLSDSGEHRVTTVSFGHVVDQLHDQDGFADAGAAEEADLTTLGVGGQQVDDFNARLQDLLLSRHVHEIGSFLMDRQELVGFDGTSFVNGFSDDVDDTSEGSGSDWDGDGSAGVDAALSADETFGTVHGDGADGRLAKMLGDLEDETRVAILDLQGVEDRRQVAIELHVDDGADDSDDLASGSSGSWLGSDLAVGIVGVEGGRGGGSLGGVGSGDSPLKGARHQSTHRLHGGAC